MSDDSSRPHLRLVRGDASPAPVHPGGTTTRPAESAPLTPGRFVRLFDLTGRVALVVGSGGLGGTIAAALADFGARMAIADLDLDAAARLARFCDRPGIEAVATELDVTDHAMVADAVASIEERCGRIDVLVNAAGINIRKPATEYTPEDWHRIIDTNLTGVFYVAQAVARGMLARGYGRILSIGSVSSLLGHPFHAPYAASKGGLAIMTKSLATEWAPRGVTINAIGPTYTETNLTRGFADDPATRDRLVAAIPMGRLGTPEDLVGAAIFLCSDAARFVTGQTLYVDGGRTAD
ncbi:MAG: gluconate 5-dehydrogenase [Thermomicrobiales bacterium]|jgi:NAD(P)-dependent dehydrogenase (short-subunit alcohol dehydrogenase family)|nr:gluconate 5-dehydrogenase [Thermomicrobiales bacterium]